MVSDLSLVWFSAGIVVGNVVGVYVIEFVKAWRDDRES